MKLNKWKRTQITRCYVIRKHWMCTRENNKQKSKNNLHCSSY